jgi:cytoskeletal protein RodZ
MKTVGQILKETRVKKAVDFEEIEKKTKIRTKYLQAIENDDYQQLPGGKVVARGFIKNYGEYLGLSSKNLLASFRRDFGQEQKGQVLPRGIYRPLGKIGFSWTPKATIMAIVLFFFCLFLSFLGYEFFLFLGPPKLQLTTPSENQVVQASVIEVKGKSDNDASVYLNEALISLDEEGNFSELINLTPGENLIRVEAVSRRGKKSVIERKVRYQFP